MNKKFRFVAVRLMAVLLLVALVIPASSAVKASDSSAHSAPVIPEQHIVDYPTHWCEFGNAYQWSSYQVFLQTDKLRNTTGQQATLDVNRSVTLSHGIEVTGEFGFGDVSIALGFTINQSVTHSVGVSLPVPPYHVGKVKTYARYVPVLSDYICYWRILNTVKNSGTVRVDRYVGIDYTTVVKPIN